VSLPDRVVRPSLEDPLVGAASESIGGPVGERAAPHPWWTPVRVVLAITFVVFALGMLQKGPCVQQHWAGGNQRYAEMCYSDLPYLYVDRGFAERVLPYSDTGGRYPALEYPVGIGYFAYDAALLTQGLRGWPDVSGRASVPVDKLYQQPGVGPESWLYFQVTAVLLAPFALLSAWFLVGAHRGRPWDAMAFAASPALLLAGLINWDLLAVACVAGALWAWSRGKPLLTGIFIGLGVATKLYPVFLLGALFCVCLRRRRMGAFAIAATAAAAAWLAMNLPAMLYGFDQWKAFWTFNAARGADLGSLWLIWQQAGHRIGPHTIDVWSWLIFAAICVAILVLAMTARRVPRWPQLAFLVVTGFLLVNKVYSPQYVLWLLPLAVLARPRWRDLLIWQAGEAFYFGMVWLYLGGYTASSASGAPDHAYWVAIVVRVAAELYLAARVVVDIWTPWRDPVRADGLTDDPADAFAGPAPVAA
jgi:uncharacterized membrane protein